MKSTVLIMRVLPSVGLRRMISRQQGGDELVCDEALVGLGLPAAVAHEREVGPLTGQRPDGVGGGPRLEPGLELSPIPEEAGEAALRLVAPRVVLGEQGARLGV